MIIQIYLEITIQIEYSLFVVFCVLNLQELIKAKKWVIKPVSLSILIFTTFTTLSFGLMNPRTSGPSDYWTFELLDLRFNEPSGYWVDPIYGLTFKRMVCFAIALSIQHKTVEWKIHMIIYDNTVLVSYAVKQ